jgi:sec-independent protein translocase protein TatA
MGPLGTPELLFIFFLAMLLFGPKELPKLGKTIGKAMTEFRRAQSELKTTFDREMKNLERETGIKELAETTFNSNSYNYDNQSAYDTSYYDASYHSDLSTTTTDGASAIQGAATSAPQITAAAGSIASGFADTGHEDYYQQTPASAPASATPVAPAPAEHSEAAPAAAGKPVNG